ncbi:MAG: hypothetical protein LBH00_00070 [Planctomycetaceae bacterium]|nr:hypothetical protein [Planctomycetaceae bacterium]
MNWTSQDIELITLMVQEGVPGTKIARLYSTFSSNIYDALYYSGLSIQRIKKTTMQPEEVDRKLAALCSGEKLEKVRALIAGGRQRKVNWNLQDTTLISLLIQEGVPGSVIARLYSVSESAIYQVLYCSGLSVRDLKVAPLLSAEEVDAKVAAVCSGEKLEQVRKLLETGRERKLRRFLLERRKTQNSGKEPAVPISEQEAERLFPPGHLRNFGTVKIPQPVISERNKDIAELRRSGLTLEEIGRRYGITRERVRTIILRFNAISDNPVDSDQVRLLNPRITRISSRREKVVALRRQGMVYKDIAQTMGLTLTTVMADIRKHNITSQEPLPSFAYARRKLTDPVVEKIIEEWKKGTKIQEIAAMAGVTYGSIHRVLKKRGLYRKPHKNRKKASRKRG